MVTQTPPSGLHSETMTLPGIAITSLNSPCLQHTSTVLKQK